MLCSLTSNMSCNLHTADVCMAVGKAQSRHGLPADIQHAVEAVKQAQRQQELPWAGTQSEIRYMQFHRLVESSAVEGSACSAVDEICRCTFLLVSNDAI